jgi:hypothetical protein
MRTKVIKNKKLTELEEIELDIVKLKQEVSKLECDKCLNLKNKLIDLTKRKIEITKEA